MWDVAAPQGLGGSSSSSSNTRPCGLQGLTQSSLWDTKTFHGQRLLAHVFCWGGVGWG